MGGWGGGRTRNQSRFPATSYACNVYVVDRDRFVSASIVTQYDEDLSLLVDSTNINDENKIQEIHVRYNIINYDCPSRPGVIY